MQKLKLPYYPVRITHKKGKPFVFDESRSKWISLTPEEWVRQQFFHFLTRDKIFPRSLIAIEKRVFINGLPQRFDMLVFDRNGLPLLIAEFKAPDIPVNQLVFLQTSRYNSFLRAPYCLVSNGMEHYLWKMDFDTGHSQYLNEIPDYEALIGKIDK